MAAYLITGATSGIGAETAQRLHARGDHLVLVARSGARAEQLHEAYDGADVRTVDLAVPETVTASLGRLPERLDGVVLSAGVAEIGPVADLGVDVWRRTFDVNVLSTAAVTQACLPALRAARGTLVLLNSMSGMRVSPGFGVYAASKYALRAFADAVRQEEAEHGVRVTGVHPGRVATPMQADIHRQEGREYAAQEWIAPGTVADAVVGALDLPPDAGLPEVVLAARPPVRRSAG